MAQENISRGDLEAENKKLKDAESVWMSIFRILKCSCIVVYIILIK